MSAPQSTFLNLPTLLGLKEAALEEMFWQKAWELRVAVPCVVTAFDSVTQTVTVQCAIMEEILRNSVPTPVTITPLPGVPVCQPGGGGLSITFPIAPGDECLVVFCDLCIDTWVQSGGTNNQQFERRRHDLSDAIAIFGVRSQPRNLASYSTTKAQLRTDDGVTLIEIGPGVINIKAAAITLEGTVTVTGDLSVSGTLDGKNFLTHTHTGVTTGSSNSGPVT